MQGSGFRVRAESFNPASWGGVMWFYDMCMYVYIYIYVYILFISLIYIYIYPSKNDDFGIPRILGARIPKP